MINYARQSIKIEFDLSGTDQIIRLQTPDPLYGYGDYSVYKNGFLIEDGFGIPFPGALYDNYYYDADGYLTKYIGGYVNEDYSAFYNRDGSYAYYKSIDIGYTEERIVNADGSGEFHSVYYGIGTDDPVKVDEVYASGTFNVSPLQPNEAALAQLKFQYSEDGEGRITRFKIIEPSGAYTDVRFDYSGAKLAERHLSYDANGKPTEEARFDADGNLYYLDRNNPDGSHTTTQYGPPDLSYFPAEPTKLSEVTYFADKSSIAYKYGASGEITETVKTAADGTKIKEFDDAAGSHTNIYIGGKLALGELIKADGSKTAIAFQKNLTIDDTAESDLFIAFGNDTFVFGEGGADVVRNFHATGDLSDYIKLVGVEAEDLSIAMKGRDTVIRFDADASVTLVNVKITDVLDNILFA